MGKQNLEQLCFLFLYSMKKTYDWDIKLFIDISPNPRRLELVTSIHTNIHKLKIEISKLLNLSVLDTHIDLYHRGKILKATSTLLQNQVQNLGVIAASVARQGKEEKKSLRNIGLSVVCSCTNQKCVNFGKDVEICYGFGVFPVLGITAATKCEFCPYKSQFLRPSMLCKELRVESCLFRLRGSDLDRGGIPVPHDSGFLKAQAERQLGQFLQERAWNIGMELTVKHL